MPIINVNPSKPKRMLRTPISVPIDLTVSSGAINPGELVYITGNYKAASLNTAGASNANAAKCIGVSLSKYPVDYTAGISGSPIPPGDPNVPMIEVAEDGDHLFNTTASETYHPYDTVYLGADGRTISTVATGSAIGYVSPDQRQSSQKAQPVLTPITGASGVQIYIRITPALAK